MLHAPELLKLFRATGIYYLTDGSLTPHDRELAVLRIAWLSRAPYEWGEHVSVSRKRGLITPEEVANAQIGSSSPFWTGINRAILKAVEELHEDSTICDATWAELAAVYNPKQLVELVMLIGQYKATAYFLNTMRIPLREGTLGMTAV